MLVFGDASLPTEHEFPKHEDLKNLPQEKLKLQTIGFKKRANMSELSGIQLQFNHGVKTPLYETQWAKNDDLQEAWVDKSKTVRKVMVRITAYDTLSMLRLIDDQSNTILEIIFKSVPSASNSDASDDESTKGYEA